MADLMSDIGGLASLWIGMSTIVVFEIIEVFMIFIGHLLYGLTGTPLLPYTSEVQREMQKPPPLLTVNPASPLEGDELQQPSMDTMAATTEEKIGGVVGERRSRIPRPQHSQSTRALSRQNYPSGSHLGIRQVK